MSEHDRFVTPSTTDSSKQDRTENGTESLIDEQQAPVSDRVSAIRARFDLWKRESDAIQEWDAIPRDARPTKSIERFLIDKCGCGHKWCGCSDEWYPVFHHQGEGYNSALDDIAWLLEQVDELTKRVRMYEVVKS